MLICKDIKTNSQAANYNQRKATFVDNIRRLTYKCWLDLLVINVCPKLRAWNHTNQNHFFIGASNFPEQNRDKSWEALTHSRKQGVIPPNKEEHQVTVLFQALSSTPATPQKPRKRDNRHSHHELFWFQTKTNIMKEVLTLKDWSPDLQCVAQLDSTLASESQRHVQY